MSSSKGYLASTAASRARANQGSSVSLPGEITLDDSGDGGEAGKENVEVGKRRRSAIGAEKSIIAHAPKDGAQGRPRGNKLEKEADAEFLLNSSSESTKPMRKKASAKRVTMADGVKVNNKTGTF